MVSSQNIKVCMVLVTLMVVALHVALAEDRVTVAERVPQRHVHFEAPEKDPMASMGGYPSALDRADLEADVPVYENDTMAVVVDRYMNNLLSLESKDRVGAPDECRAHTAEDNIDAIRLWKHGWVLLKVDSDSTRDLEAAATAVEALLAQDNLEMGRSDENKDGVDDADRVRRTGPTRTVWSYSSARGTRQAVEANVVNRGQRVLQRVAAETVGAIETLLMLNTKAPFVFSAKSNKNNKEDDDDDNAGVGGQDDSSSKNANRIGSSIDYFRQIVHTDDLGLDSETNRDAAGVFESMTACKCQYNNCSIDTDIRSDAGAQSEDSADDTDEKPFDNSRKNTLSELTCSYYESGDLAWTNASRNAAQSTTLDGCPPHEDTGLITTIFATGSGLEVFDYHCGSWQRIEHVPGSVIVLRAQALSFALSGGDRWQYAAAHRVRAPSSGRVSLAWKLRMKRYAIVDYNRLINPTFTEWLRPENNHERKVVPGWDGRRFYGLSIGWMVSRLGAPTAPGLCSDTIGHYKQQERLSSINKDTDTALSRSFQFNWEQVQWKGLSFKVGPPDADPSHLHEIDRDSNGNKLKMEWHWHNSTVDEAGLGNASWIVHVTNSILSD